MLQTQSDPLVYFLEPAKYAKVRWVPTHSNAELLFVTSNYDKVPASLSLWSCHQNADSYAPNFDINKIDTCESSESISDLVIVTPELMLSSSSTGKVHLYSITDKHKRSRDHTRRITELQTSENFGSTVSKIAIQRHRRDPDIAAVTESGSLITLNFETMTTTMKIQKANEMALTGIAYRNTNEIVTTSESGLMQIWDTRTNTATPSRTLSSMKSSPLTSLSVHSVQQDKIATGTEFGDIIIWDLRGDLGSETKTFKAHNSTVWEVMFHPSNGNEVLSCSEDGKVCILDWTQEEDIVNPYANQQNGPTRSVQSLWNALSINSIDCHPENGIILGGGDMGSITLQI